MPPLHSFLLTQVTPQLRYLYPSLLSECFLLPPLHTFLLTQVTPSTSIPVSISSIRMLPVASSPFLSSYPGYPLNFDTCIHLFYPNASCCLLSIPFFLPRLPPQLRYLYPSLLSECFLLPPLHSFLLTQVTPSTSIPVSISSIRMLPVASSPFLSSYPGYPLNFDTCIHLFYPNASCCLLSIPFFLPRLPLNFYICIHLFYPNASCCLLSIPFFLPRLPPQLRG